MKESAGGKKICVSFGENIYVCGNGWVSASLVAGMVGVLGLRSAIEDSEC